jgi:hypothetical protein
MNLPNARQALEAIKEDSANIKSRIIRYVVPLLGGPEGKIRNQEPGLLFLESISPQQFVDLDLNLLNQRLKGLEEVGVITNDLVRNVRSSFQKFKSFLLNMKWAVSIEPHKDDQTTNFRRKHPEQLIRQPYKAPYALGACEGDYQNEYLKKQIEEFFEFLLPIKKRGGDKGVKAEIKDVLFVLGWLTGYNTPEPIDRRFPNKTINRVRSEKISMSELRLENLVPFVRLNLREAHSKRRERQDAEDDAYEEATTIAKKMIVHIEKFLDFYSPAASSRYTVLRAYLNVAKFLYRNERRSDTRQGYDEDYKGIPAVQEIRKLCNKYRKEAKSSQPVVPRSKKTIPWLDEDDSQTLPDIYDILLHLKSLTNAKKRNLVKTAYQSEKKRSYRKNRTPLAISKNYYRFLILAFFCVLPPARQQVLRNLVIGESFVWGEIVGEEVIDASQMLDPSKARWIIGLRHGKTFTTYGFHPYYLPNHQFPDGTFLYDYMNKWVDEYRILLEPKTDHLFIGPMTQIELTPEVVYKMVRRIIEGLTGMAVGPHELRRLFNSHIENGHVNPQLKTNMRNRQMTQSDEIAKEVYTTSDAEKIDRPMNDFFQGMISTKGKINVIIPDLPPRYLTTVDLWGILTPEQKASLLVKKV